VAPARPSANADDVGDIVDKRRDNGGDRYRYARPLAAISVAVVTVCLLAACAPPPAAQQHDGFRRAFAHVRGIT
jgi:hypothetical protein